MPVNISVNLPRQYLRAGSSVAEVVVEVDSARLRFAAVGAAAAPVALMDCLRLSLPGGGDVDVILDFVDVTLLRRRCAPVAVAFSSPPSPSESDEEAVGMRLLFARFWDRLR